MYIWIWRTCPGNVGLRSCCRCWCSSRRCRALLLFVVFPWVEPHLPFSHVT